MTCSHEWGKPDPVTSRRICVDCGAIGVARTGGHWYRRDGGPAVKVQVCHCKKCKEPATVHRFTGFTPGYYCEACAPPKAVA